MALLPTVGHVIDAAAGGLLLALGLAAWMVRPPRPDVRAFAVFSMLFGASFVLGNLVGLDDPAAPGLHVIAFGLTLAAGIAVLRLALVFPRPLEPGQRRRAGLVALPAVVLGAAYFGLVLAGHARLGSLPSLNLSDGLTVLQYFLFAALLLMAARFAWAAGPSADRERGQLALIATGLVIWPAFFAATRLRPGGYPETIAGLLEDPGRLVQDPFNHAFTLFFGLGGLAFLWALGAVWLWCGARWPGASRPARTAALACIGAPVLGYIAFAYFIGIGGTSGLYGSVRVVAVAVLAYALLRYRVFDLDLRVKRGVERGLLVGAFAGTYLVAAYVGSGLAPGTAVAVGLVAMVGLAALLGPLQLAARRASEAAMPAVSGSAEYLNLRRLEVYRVALEQAAVAPAGNPDTPQLAALREELGISERDHAVLLSAVRAPARGGAWLGPGDLVLGRYRVAGFLGEGAHGRTYLADDTASGGRVVLKSIRPDRGAEALLREARALRALRHPHVVALREVDLVDGAVVIVMEALEGSLARRLEAGPLAPSEFARVGHGLLAALEAVHVAGIVHRDVKPSNVLLAADGEAKLGDFGIAHLPGLETTVGGAGGGTAAGTIRYMSPEQAKGKKVTPRSDLFSAAATLYEAWTGRPWLEPRPRESPMELQMRAAAGRAFKGKVQPAALRTWFARALDPEPARRFASAGEMREALDRALPVLQVTRG